MNTCDMRCMSASIMYQLCINYVSNMRGHGLRPPPCIYQIHGDVTDIVYIMIYIHDIHCYMHDTYDIRVHSCVLEQIRIHVYDVTALYT